MHVIYVCPRSISEGKNIGVLVTKYGSGKELSTMTTDTLGYHSGFLRNVSFMKNKIDRYRFIPKNSCGVGSIFRHGWRSNHLQKIRGPFVPWSLSRRRRSCRLFLIDKGMKSRQSINSWLKRTNMNCQSSASIDLETVGGSTPALTST